MKKIVLATRNAGKIKELADALRQHNFEVLGLETFPELEDIEENGSTFEENALLKARHVARNTGLIAVADDSGLEVDALKGAPGVYSARYANDLPPLKDETKDQRNNRKLLLALKNTPEHERAARFVCCMAVYTPQEQYFTVRGTWEGNILLNSLGENGFGYDPVFWDESSQKSAAQLTKNEKLARSHRGTALKLLLAQWDKYIK